MKVYKLYRRYESDIWGDLYLRGISFKLLVFFSFIFFYMLYFLKKINKRSFAIPVSVALLFAFNLNYFIESLSLVLFFEVLMFLNIKEKEEYANH